MSNKTTQGTVKVVNPETNGTIRPERNRLAEINAMLKEVGYTKELTDDQKLKLWSACLIHQLGWEATHAEIDAKIEAYKNQQNELVEEGCGNDTADLLASMR